MKKLTQIAQKFNLKSLVNETKALFLLEDTLEIAFPDSDIIVTDLRGMTAKDAKVKDVFERKYLPFNFDNDKWMAKYLQQNAYLLQKEKNMSKLEANKKPNKFYEINLDVVNKFMQTELSFFQTRMRYESALMRYLANDRVHKLMNIFGLESKEGISRESRAWLRNEYPLAAANLAEIERFNEKKVSECKEVLFAMVYNKDYLLGTLGQEAGKLKKLKAKTTFLKDARFQRPYEQYQQSLKKLNYYNHFVKQGMKNTKEVEPKTNC